jgi:hypothetical protein
MCHLITGTFPASANLDSLRPVLAAHGRDFRPYESAEFATQLPKGTSYGFLSQGMCDCGTVLGRGAPADDEKGADRKVRKLRAKGWGDVKIQRWIEEKRRGREHARQLRLQDEAKELAAWLGLIRDCLSSGHTAYIGIIKQWGGGQACARREAVRPEQLTAEFLLGMAENVLYEFHAGR